MTKYAKPKYDLSKKEDREKFYADLVEHNKRISEKRSLYERKKKEIILSDEESKAQTAEQTL